MKKFINGLLLSCLVIIFGSGSVLAADKYINQVDIDAITRAQSAINNFTTTIDNTNSTQEDINDAGLAARDELSATISLGFYYPSLGSAYTAAGEKIKATCKALQTDIISVMSVGGQPPVRQIDQAFFDEYNNHIDAFNNAADGLSAAVETANTTNTNERKKNQYMMLAPFVLSLAVLAWLYSWTSHATSEKLKEARKAVANSFIAPVVGIGITALTYVFAEKLGGKYVMTWGLVVFGLIIFIQAVVAYQKVKNQPDLTQNNNNAIM